MPNKDTKYIDRLYIHKSKGFIYAPYIPVQTTEVIQNEEDTVIDERKDDKDTK